MGKQDMSDSDDERETDHVSSAAQDHQDILSQVVDDAFEYDAVKKPGPLTLSHLTLNTELYLITLPKDLFEPMKLIQTDLVVGSTKERGVKIGKQEYQMATYPITSQTLPPSLFLPDKDGSLCKVDDHVLKGHIVFRGQPQPKEGVERIDIQSLYSKRHVPPSDLRPRKFFNSKGKGIVRRSTGTGGKAKKRKEMAVEEEVDSSQIKKKKKKSNIDTSFSLPLTDVKEEMSTPKRKDKKLTSPGNSSVTPSQEGKKSKKSKNGLTESNLVSSDEDVFMSQSLLDSSLSQKSKKKNSKNKKNESEDEDLSQSTKKNRKGKNKVKFDHSQIKAESDNENSQFSDDLFAELPKKKKSKKGKNNVT